jgi:hypothetical protein
MGDAMRCSKARVLAMVLAGSLLQLAAPVCAQDDDYANPDRPGIADGSKVIDAGQVEVEIGVQEELRNDGDAHDRRIFFPALLRVGLGSNLEARVETNSYTWERSNDPVACVQHTQGGAPVSVGMKYQFAQSDGIAHPSLGVIARIFPASGSGNFATHHVTGDVRLAADWDVASKWSLNPNIGVASYEDDSGRRFTAGLFALTLNFNPSKKLNFFLDTGQQFPERKNGRTSIIVDGGVAYMVNKDIQLDFSMGTKVAGETPPHPFLAAGVSKRF